MDTEKLYGLFKRRYDTLAIEADERSSDGSDEEDEFFINYCDKHKIIMLHSDWMCETLNSGGMRNRVCIVSPEEDEECAFWLLVPKKFAEKALVLGGLP
jgi:hypothetical protein